MAADRIIDGPEGPLIARGLIDELTGIRKDQAAGFATLQTALLGKADKTDVVRLEARLEAAERERAKDAARIAALEADKTLREERAKVHLARDTKAWSFKARLGAGVLAVIGCGAAITDAILRAIGA